MSSVAPQVVFTSRESESGTSGRPLALVTGASGGIGTPLCRELHRRGYRLLMIGRRPNELRQTVAALEPGAQITAMALDLGDPRQIEGHVGPMLSRMGPVEVLVNGAGVGLYRPFLEHSEADLHRLMQLHFHAAADLIRRTLPQMLERRRGWVINIASISTKLGPWGHAGYSAAKSALVTMTQTLAAEHAGSGVHMCYVNPGIVDTPYFSRAGVRGLWAGVKRHAICPERTARRIAQLLDRPQLELCIPGHYRLLDFMRAISVAWTLKLVARGSRPRSELRIEDGLLPPARPAPVEGPPTGRGG